MDLNAIANSIAQFLGTDAGAAIGRFLNAAFQFFYPSNAEAAWEVPLPVTSPKK